MNYLELNKESSGKFSVTIKSHDGVEMWEIFNETLSEEAILGQLQQRKHFQQHISEWTLSIPYDQHIIRASKFDQLIKDAISYLQERDFPGWQDDYI